MRAIIIDDEKLSLATLSKMLDLNCPEIEVIGKHQRPAAGLEAIRNEKPDIVFLDIEMPGMNGFDLLNSLDKIDFDVIFTTAYDEFALRAFKVSAMDYLLKPIDSEDFIQAIDRLNKSIANPTMNSQIQLLLNNLKKEDHKKTIRIPTSEGFEIIEVKDIIHCNADTSYTHLYTTNSKLLVSKPIKYFEDLLKDANFFRIHNSHLVNINHVKKYTKGKGGYVTMSNNTAIDVSTRKKEEFLLVWLISLFF